jgi:hypothetical protein
LKTGVVKTIFLFRPRGWQRNEASIGGM